MDVILTRFDVVEPDLLYVSNARARGLRADLKVGPYVRLATFDWRVRLAGPRGDGASAPRGTRPTCP